MVFVAALVVAPFVSLAQADGGAAREAGTGRGPRFLAPGLVGEGTQTVLLAVPWTPGAPTSAEAAAFGYKALVLAPQASFRGAVPLADLVQAVAACPTTAAELDDAPQDSCTALTASASCSSLAATAYCVETDTPLVGRLTLRFGQGQTPLRLELEVPKQPVPGTIEALSLQFMNDAWAPGFSSSLAVVEFTTALPVATVLRLLDGPNGEGEEVVRLSTTTDGSHRIHAAGFDDRGIYAGDLSSTQWSVAPEGIVVLSATQGGSVLLNPVKDGAATLTATAGDLTASAIVDVALGAIARIEILDAPGGQGARVDDVTMRVEEAKQLFAASYDADGNFLGDEDAAWTVTPLESPCGAVTTQQGAAVFEATTPGGRNCFVHAAAASRSDSTGRVAVTPGAGLLLSIVDEDGDAVGDTTLTASEELRLFARMQDVDGNLIAPTDAVSWRVVGGCGVLNTTLGPRATFDATRVTPTGACRILASTLPEAAAETPADAPAAPAGGGALSTPVLAATGYLAVAPGEPALVKIRSASGGAGVEVGSPVWTTDEAQTLYAAVYDADLNYVGEAAEASWALTTPVGALSATTGASVTLDPTTPGTATLSIQVGELADSTGLITIVVGALDAIRIRSAANDAGVVLSDLQIDHDASTALHAAGYDADDNYVADSLYAAWAVVGECGEVARNADGSATFTAGSVPRDGCSVTATDGATVGRVNQVIIDAGPVTRLEIRDADATDAFDVPRSAGVPVQLYAAGWGADDTFLGNQTRALWSVVSDDEARCGTVEPSVGAVVTFTPTKTNVAGCKVLVSVDDVVATSGLVQVRPGSTTSVTVAGMPSSYVAGSALPSVTVTVLDAYGNVNTTFHEYGGRVSFALGSPNRVTSPVHAVERVPGDYLFTASDAGVHTFEGSEFAIKRVASARTLTFSAKAIISGATPTTVASKVETFAVTPADLAKFTLTWAGSASVVAGQPLNTAITLTALDAFDNTVTHYLGTATLGSTDARATAPEAVTFSASEAGVKTLPAGTFSFRTAGSVKVSATDGAATNESQASVTVTPAPAQRLVVTVPGESYSEATFAVTGAPTAQVAGAEFRVDVRAVDEFGNVLKNAGPNTYNGNKNLVFSGLDGWEGKTPTARQDTTTSLPTDFGAATQTSFSAGVGRYQVALYRAVDQAITVTDSALGIAGTTSSVSVDAAAAFRVVVLHDGCGSGVTDRSCIVASAAETETWTPTVGTEYRLVAVAADQWDNLIGSTVAQWSGPQLSPGITSVSEKVIWTPKDTTEGTLAVGKEGHVATTVEIAPQEAE